jgi:hypothetical protein
MVSGKRPRFVIVSSKEEGPPSSATEIVTGEISTVSTRRSVSPVTHMFEPPSISGEEQTGGTSLTKEESLLKRPHTQGQVEM